MSNQTRISAKVSGSTKEALDRFTTKRGLRQSYVVEQALLFYMEARRELPDEAIIPMRIVVEDAAFDAVVKQLDRT